MTEKERTKEGGGIKDLSKAIVRWAIVYKS